MNRDELRKNVELAALYIAETEALIGKREVLIAELKKYGLEISGVQQKLNQERDLLKQQQADWDRLRDELEELE